MNARISIVTVGLVVAAVGPAAAEVPPHPDEIVFPPLVFEPPAAQDYRHQLSNGVVVYLAPSHELPLVDLRLTFRGGRDLDPPEQARLVAATAAMMRQGGTTRLSPRAFDEELDFLAAVAASRGGRTRTTASLNSLASNFEKSFALFMDMVRHPGFDAERLTLYKAEQLERMKQRNDHARRILMREWRFLLYGEDHFEARLPTAASIESITADDLRAMHRRIIHPGNLIVAANGDFEPSWMLSRLEEAFAGWEAGPPVPGPPAPQVTLSPGLYHVEKDIPQGRVAMGLRAISRDDPDYFPLLLANRILGGGGFTSRIVSRVRSDEGLAYSARSALIPRVEYPGEFSASFQSKNRTVALATKIILEEIERMRTEPVSDEELETAKQALIERFPRTFESKEDMIDVFVDDELTDRAPGYWRSYRDNVRAVTAQDIMRVARKYMVPARMAILAVGPWAQIAPGDLEGRASMDAFFGGNVTHLPLRDPLTLEARE